MLEEFACHHGSKCWNYRLRRDLTGDYQRNKYDYSYKLFKHDLCHTPTTMLLRRVIGDLTKNLDILGSRVLKDGSPEKLVADECINEITYDLVE